MNFKFLPFTIFITFVFLGKGTSFDIDNIPTNEENQSVSPFQDTSVVSKMRRIWVKMPPESSTSFLIKPLYSTKSPGTIYFKSQSLLTKEIENEFLKRDEAYHKLDWKNENLREFQISISFPTKLIPYSLAIPMNLSGVIVSESMTNANLIWGYPPKIDIIPNFYKSIKNYQKYNHFPTTWDFGFKDKLWKNYVKKKNEFPLDYDYMPATYLLPKDKKHFSKELKNDPKAMWLIKPKLGESGNKIRLLQNENSIPHDCLITRYISNPHLINNKKYDLRLYVLVSGFTPLKIYLFPEGLVRFATDDYNNDVENYGNKYIHLTNWSINKNSNKFDYDNINVNDECRGSTWSVGALRRHFKSQNLNFEQTWDKIKDIVAKTVISLADKTIKKIESLTNHRNNLFELYGYDIMIDDTLRPWLLEVNTYPTMESFSWMDLKIKSGYMSSLLNIIGLVPYSKKVDEEIPKLLFQEESYTYNIILLTILG